jgi:signal transduction histidine kinase
VMTGHGTIDTAVKCMQLGALDYMQKPFDAGVARAVIGRALQIRRLRLDNAHLLAREREHLAELEAAYQDLDAFSISISHDLRAPLRAMLGFTDAFLTDHAAVIPEGGRRQLDNVVKSGARLDRMLEDLLRFCRFSRQPLHKQPVDCNELVANVLAQMRSRFQSHAPQVHVEPLPTCSADRSLLEQVFVNLLSNAYKFTRHTPAPRIDIGVCGTDDEDALFVRDNGAGFDLRYAARLFGVFQRLHSERDFEGTGVGLSIVRRIIERHGGRIWAQSAPGEGATFRFTLGTRITRAM